MVVKTQLPVPQKALGERRVASEVGRWLGWAFPTSCDGQVQGDRAETYLQLVRKAPLSLSLLGHCLLAPFHFSLSSPTSSPQTHMPGHRLQSGRQLNTWSFGLQVCAVFLWKMAKKNDTPFSVCPCQHQTIHSPRTRRQSFADLIVRGL